MKNYNFKAPVQVLELLKELKELYGISYTESLQRGVFLLAKEMRNNPSALELGKAYQDVLIRRRNEKL